jgi:membrane protein YqaA with SNARE-associated domain
MFAEYIIAISPWVRYLRHLGGVGLAILGVVGAVLPIPAGLEILTVWLAARHRDVWWYYGLMATLGSSIGSCLYYFLGWTGGTQLLAKRLSVRQAKIWTARLQSWGFGMVLLSGLVPPPLPSSPMLLAAGAVRYPRKRFVSALVLGRAIRFLLLAFAAYVYRRRALRMMNHYLVPIIVVGVIAMAGYAIFIWFQTRKDRQSEQVLAAETEATIPQSEPLLPAPNEPAPALSE